jgi:hypothetical protein
VAAELGIADLLHERPMTIEELANATESHPRTLYRVLRALAAFGIFAETSRGQFQLTEAAECLRTDVVGSLRDWTVLTGTKPMWQALEQALEMVKTGRSGFALAHPEHADLYRFGRQHPEFSATFIRAQSNWTDWQRDAILRVYDFSRFPMVVDVGGGRGSMISGILRQCPNSRGVLYDQPQSIEQAKAVTEAAGVASRCELVPGSFLDRVPSGGDAYVIKHVLRDWDDEHAGTILRNCHDAMGPDATLLVIDAVLDPSNLRDRIGKLLDIEQMVWLDGVLRTNEEWSRLLEQAGFRIQQQSRTNVVDAVILQAAKIAR